MVSSRSIYKFLIDLVYPNRCSVCGRLIHWDKLVCEDCEKDLPFNRSDLCEICGKDRCIDHSTLHYDGIVTLMRYEGSGKEAILKLKNDKQLGFAEYSAQKLAKIIASKSWFSDIDIITAVPMHITKIRTRGYNQAQKIAHYLAKDLHLQENYKLICRTSDTAEQHSLKAKERKEFANRVFYPSTKHIDVKGKNILLCDDIYTTGSTLNSCAKILKEQGAQKVYCAAIATTLYKE